MCTTPGGLSPQNLIALPFHTPGSSSRVFSTRIRRPSDPMATLMRAALLACAVGSARGAGSALVEGTTVLTPSNFDGFITETIAAGKTAMVRFIASEG